MPDRDRDENARVLAWQQKVYGVPTQPGDMVTIGVTPGELALLETNADNDNPGFDRLAAKIKAAQAGRPADWLEYLIFEPTGADTEPGADDG
jgi:hypothetical protein